MSAIATAVAVTGFNYLSGKEAASAQKKASGQAARAQLDATDKQIDFLKQSEKMAANRLSPFVKLGTSNIPELQDILTPQGQYNYLANNPMFNAAIDYTGRQIKDASAAAGKLQSGGTLDKLMQNYLATGENYAHNQYSRLMNAVNTGQSSAAGQASNAMNLGSNVSNVLGNQGDIASGNLINRANIDTYRQQQTMDMLGGGLLGGLGSNRIKGYGKKGGIGGALLGMFAGSGGTN